MFKNPLLLVAMTLCGVVAVWGIFDTPGLANFARTVVGTMFTFRGWFIMLTASTLLLTAIWLAFSRYGRLKLGQEEDEPEFSTISWLSMLFAAGMGVGLLFFGTAEPLSHYGTARDLLSLSQQNAAEKALFITYFHWGLHGWATFAITGLVIAYFGFRKGCPNLISAPIEKVFGARGLARYVGWYSDLLAIYAIAIGMAGAIAMGVFQVQSGVESLFALTNPGAWLTLLIFVIMCVACILPLMVDLGQGMALLSNIAMGITGGLMVFVLLMGPTYFMMSGIVGSIGDYVADVLPHGFRTFTFFDDKMTNWFQTWTLNYMVWWLAWSPFVGVFIARISKGRTIREYLLGVICVPTLFVIFWFGIFGGIGFYGQFEGNEDVLQVVQTNFNGVTFFVLKHLPLPVLTIAATAAAAFLFVVTSVVSAAFVLSMFSTGGDSNPSTPTKLIWGVILAALGLVMILSDSIEAVRQIIALGALPFVFIVLLIMVCLLKSLKSEVVE